MTKRDQLQVELRDAIRLWLQPQGLLQPRGSRRLTKKHFLSELERTGGLQIDPINVVERAPYLTLWSRFGSYRRSTVDRWIYRDRLAMEYWAHEASIMPMSHLAIGRRRMLDFPPKSWRNRAWWSVYQTSVSSKRRVLRRLQREGPLESADFELRPHESKKRPGGGMPLSKEDTRSLKLLWHAGKVAVHERRSWRCVYDLAERVYPDVGPVSRAEYEGSWLTRGVHANGIVSERHLANYITAPNLSAKQRRDVIARSLTTGALREVRITGLKGSYLVDPSHLDLLSSLDEPAGTNLLCPFDSFLWQRLRAEEFLSFRYRIEIYVPPAKRQFGYYVLPILHQGQLVGRLDPKFHRETGTLEIKRLYLEPSFKRSRDLAAGLREALSDLMLFLDARELEVPRSWARALS